jgi:hypothetical protein
MSLSSVYILRNLLFNISIASRFSVITRCDLKKWMIIKILLEQLRCLNAFNVTFLDKLFSAAPNYSICFTSMTTPNTPASQCAWAKALFLFIISRRLNMEDEVMSYVPQL